jgi:hypothetical protein
LLFKHTLVLIPRFYLIIQPIAYFLYCVINIINYLNLLVTDYLMQIIHMFSLPHNWPSLFQSQIQELVNLSDLIDRHYEQVIYGSDSGQIFLSYIITVLFVQEL